jgi:hypothetical protein
VAAGIAAGYLTLVDPNQPGRYPACPIRWLTGIWCPGCGGLRALHDLSQGRLEAAGSANLVVVMMVPVAVVLWVRWVRDHAHQGNCQSSPQEISGDRFVPAWFLWSSLVLILLFGVLRNLSVTVWLAP